MARIVKEAEGNAMARRVKTTEVWQSIADQLLAAVAVEKSIVTETRHGHNTPLHVYITSDRC